MCQVSELIEYLQTLPPDCEVEVVIEKHSHYETYTEWGPLELGDYSDTMYLFSDKQALQLGDR